ncbi:hypothetical protein KKC88_06375 [Patescibacteria group bacterium]|nr:hypothetical protein [Patescibacteria group bacterium]MBU1673892.1 hypothetical protein [Patescibacteria group bacterium]MBU1963435.1 hypothetical protein [Patescibacteria group bacterium]
MKKLLIISLFCALGALVGGATAQASYNKNIMVNGDFEAGFTGWYCTINGSPVCNQSEFITVDDNEEGYYLTLGGANSRETVSQEIDIPYSAYENNLNFMLRFTPATESANDYVTFKLTAADCKDSCAERRIQFGSAKYDEWQYYEYDVSKLRGQRIRIEFDYHENGDGQHSWVNIDDVVLKTKSRSTIKGTVKNYYTGKIVKRAKVKIKNTKGKILWSGKTNLKGKFKATKIKGGAKKKRIIVSKGDYKKVFKKRIKWGKTYTNKYWINRPVF